MKLAEIMYAWTPATWESSPTAGQVRVGVHPDRVGWTRPFASCLGACDLSFAEASDSERIIHMFVAFHAMVVRDGLDPQVVHTAGPSWSPKSLTLPGDIYSICHLK